MNSKSNLPGDYLDHVNNLTKLLTQTRSTLSIINDPENIENLPIRAVSESLWLIEDQIERIENELQMLCGSIKELRAQEVAE